MNKSKTLLILLLLSAIHFVKAQTLDEYLVIAAENNPGLKAKYAEFEAALEKVAQVNALPDPTMSFGVFISPVETRVGPQRAKIGLTQMFPWFGTLAAKENMSTLMAEAKYQEFINAKNELFYEVKSAWYPLYELNRKDTLQRENLGILLTYRQLAESAYKNGKTSMVDILRVEVMIDNTATEIEILDHMRKPLSVRFNRLLNRPDTLPVFIDDTLALISINDVSMHDSLFHDHPLIRKLDLSIASAKASEEVARKQGMPKFGVGLDYMIIGQRSDMDVPDNGKDAFMPMVSVSVPIYRSKYKAAIKEAQFTQQALEYYRQETENKLSAQYEMILFEMYKAEQQIELFQGQIAKTDQIISLLISAYSNSGKEFEEILRMQQAQLKYNMTIATATKDFYTALARLNYLTSKTKVYE